MAHLLGAESLHLEYPTRIVFDSVTVGVNEGDRIGIVGRNGEGKSSLLGMLTGRVRPNSGRVTSRADVTIGELRQSDDIDLAATVRMVLVGDTPEYVWASNPKVRDVLAGLVGDIDLDTIVGTLSGGLRRRVAMAALLIEDRDVVVLDEPTNHLDLAGISWLAEHLRNRWTHKAGGLLVVTHDRWFLDAVCTTTWEVHDRMVEPFDGGYAAYVLQRVERDRIAAVTEARRKNVMRKELAWLRRGAPARSSKPKFRIEAANQLIADVPEPRDRVELARLATARLGKDVVDVLDASVSYGDLQVLNDVTWRIGPGERSGILGANGAGKSTLLGVISGTVQVTSGRVKRGKTVRLGVLDQQFAELEEIADDRVSDVLGRTKTTFAVDGTDVTPAQLLERLGFASAHLSARVRDLSGGQRRRLQLLMVLLSEPNVLILDEPTNDVDTEMLASLEDVLDSWPGTLLVVSHDRYLMERVTDQQYAILDGRLVHLPGGADEYLQMVAARPSASRLPASGEAKRANPGSRGTNGGLSGKALRDVEKELASLERRIGRLQQQVTDGHIALADLDQSDYMLLAAEARKIAAVEAEIAELEDRWLELSVRAE